MTIHEKAAAYDKIVALISIEQTSEKELVMRQVGTLKVKQGIKGFKPVEVGDPVFELGDRYILVMETMDGKSSAQVPYYKETLGHIVEFSSR